MDRWYLGEWLGIVFLFMARTWHSISFCLTTRREEKKNHESHLEASVAIKGRLLAGELKVPGITFNLKAEVSTFCTKGTSADQSLLVTLVIWKECCKLCCAMRRQTMEAINFAWCLNLWRFTARHISNTKQTFSSQQHSFLKGWGCRLIRINIQYIFQLWINITSGTWLNS